MLFVNYMHKPKSNVAMLGMNAYWYSAACSIHLGAYRAVPLAASSTACCSGQTNAQT